MPHDDGFDKKVSRFQKDDVMNLIQNIFDNMEHLFILSVHICHCSRYS